MRNSHMRQKWLQKRLDDLNPRSLKKLLWASRRREKNKSAFEIFVEESREPFDLPPFFPTDIMAHVACAQRISTALITDAGQFDATRAAEEIARLEKNGLWRDRWTLYALKKFEAKWILALHAPERRGLLRQTFGAEITRESLNLDATHVITDADVRRAALCAYLTDLRQEVGSCFATAPARLIRAQAPEQFFSDLQSILVRGHIIRVHEGAQVDVPACRTWGRGGFEMPFPIEPFAQKTALILSHVCGLSFIRVWHWVKRQRGIWTMRRALEALQGSQSAATRLRALTLSPLLKVWEYTLASFSDLKLEFHHWNSFHALGINPEVKGGIGAFLVSRVEERSGDIHKEIEEFEIQIQSSQYHLNALTARANNASSEKDFLYLKGAINGENARLGALMAERNQLGEALYSLSNMIGPLLRCIGDHFTRHFAEVFDPNLSADVASETFIPDDRAAGFRLVYKHGRTDPASWTYIYDEQTWVHYLSLFFTQIGAELGHKEPFEHLPPAEFQRLMQWIQHWLSMPDLTESANARCAAHRPGSTAWSTVAGGTVHHLLSLYTGRPLPFREEKAEPAEGSELLASLIEATYALGLAQRERMAKDFYAGLILLAPRHCATFHPGWPAFFEGWRREQYPFTWIRDHVIGPRKEQIDGFAFDPFTAIEFARRLGVQVDVSSVQSPAQMKAALNHAVYADRLDFALYTWLPMIKGDQLDESVTALCRLIGIRKELCFKQVSSYSVWSKLDLFNCVRLCGDISDEVLESAARTLNLSLATSLPFADSNWTRDYLSFVLAPDTHELEVWRTDPSGMSGFPIRSWQGPHKQWSVFLETFFL